jgi:histidine triad (HIT) family protein
MTDCIFCKIVAKQMPTEILFEDEQLVVFKDIHPKASVHLLIVSKQHIKSLAEVSDNEAGLMSHMLRVIPKLAQEQGLTGFRTVINTGRAGGQVIDHLHFHLLGEGNK